MVNGEGPQQVILVQVNPGEAFTIQREDGQFQCITGPAQVPMMSPNGSVPPIYVPPGYVSQIIEENGVRRVLVLPQQPEFHPGGHSPLHHPPPPPHAHLPAFIPHPAMMPPPPHLYTGMCCPFLPPVSTDSHSQHGRPPFVHRDDRTSKTYERLQKKLKDRQGGGGGGGGQVKDSPPPSPQKTCSSPPTVDIHNGVGGKGLEAEQGQLSHAVAGPDKVQAMCNCLQGSPSESVSFTTLSCEPEPPNPPRKASGTKNTLVLQWKAPCDNGSKIQNYILQWDEGKGTGIYEQCYYGAQKQYRVTKLSPASRYSFRLAAKNDMGVSEFSEVVDLFTSCSVPLPPFPPELEMAGVTWLCLKWQRPTSSPKEDDIYYVLEMEEEGSGYGFQPSYDGDELSCTVRNLHRSTKYKFRVAAYNSEGKSNPSQVVEFITNPDRPSCPCRPVIRGRVLPNSFKMAWGEHFLSMPFSLSKRFTVTCSLSWDLVYSGPAMEHVCEGLKPGCSYQTRVYCMSEGGQSPVSHAASAHITKRIEKNLNLPPNTTCKSPSCVVVSWEAPPCNGAPVTEFRLEWGAAEGSMQMCYSGPALSHEMKGLLPATNYFCRTQAVNVAGVGPFSEAVLCQTPCSVPAAVSNIYALKESELQSAPHPPLFYSPSTCLGICWDPPCDHGSEITSYLIDLGERQPVVVGPVIKHIIQHLQPDTSYRLRIQALNSLGAGPFSHTFKLKTKPLPPQPPRLECTAFSHQTLRLKWGDGPAKAATSDALQYQLQMGDKSGRFISLYKGPCHTHKVQRLNESTSYTFRIQAFNEAGEGPFSNVYTFTTPRSPPAPVKAPKVERLDDNSCEVTWEALSPMKGDPILYTLQCMLGNSEFKQAYKGSATSFHVQNLQPSSDYRFRVCAIRQCQDAPELSGPYSPTVTLSPQRNEVAVSGGATGSGSRAGTESNRARRSLTDEQCAFLLLMVFAVIAILIAFVIQYFVIK
uniref:Fibronectin type-III domain-containing protein 3A n=1 Tax=Sparus aurata TaxID=8175 RepID=A0A671UDA2_SPAAU